MHRFLANRLFGYAMFLVAVLALAACAGSDGDGGGDGPPDGASDAAALPDTSNDMPFDTGPGADAPAGVDVSADVVMGRDTTTGTDTVAAPDAARDTVTALDTVPVPDTVLDTVPVPDTAPDTVPVPDTVPDTAPDTALPPDVPPPPPCEGPHPCAGEWGLPPGVGATCETDGDEERCDWFMIDGEEPLTTFVRAFQGAYLFRRRLHPLTADGAPLDCAVPTRERTTPDTTACCAGGGVDSLCESAADAWNTPTWAALGVSFDGPHRYAYAFDREPDRIIVRAETPANCAVSPDCRHRLTLVALFASGCGIQPPFIIDHSLVGRCPPEAGTPFHDIDLSAAQQAAFRPAQGVDSLNPDWDEVEGQLEDAAAALAAVWTASPAGACAFPGAAGVTPVEGTCCAALGGPDANGDGRCDGVAPGFALPPWSALDFAPNAPAFVFDLAIRTIDGTPQAEVSAYGDLDCDGVQSTFRAFVRPVEGGAACDAAVVPGLFTAYETE